MTGSNDIMEGNNSPNAKFLCGVVEGFYGRPWTTEQRKELFSRMKRMGMNTYLYAPKDDCKHRAYWRDLYSVEEADHLTSLIESARESSVTFIYALSPGIDMTYSSTKDVSYLKRKLDQVAQFGCNAFALLFDDIEPEMCETDKEIFQSFAYAQVSVTNEVYQHLGQPLFLFCPTEYCATRAVPSVANSEYLNTIGARLLPAIDIMWTGPKVISKLISSESVDEIAKVLHRPPVIWDNIHANDYDQKRLFLGPYDGRPSEIIPKLNGVLTNPNCEFEANYIALHTLAQWSKSSITKSDVLPSDSPVSSAIKLETENDSGDVISCRPPTLGYQPRQALMIAIKDWLAEFYLVRNSFVKAARKSPVVDLGLPNMNTVNTCMAVTQTTATPSGIPLPMTNLNEMNLSYLQPTMNPVMNSLVDPPSSSDSESSSVEGDVESVDTEPMEVVPIPCPLPKLDPSKPETDVVMQVDSCDTDSPSRIKPDQQLSDDDVLLLVELFYLPYEHGLQAVNMLNDFHWLKTHAHLITDQVKNEQDMPEALEWRDKATKFDVSVKRVMDLSDRLFRIPNRSLLYDLYPYLWDMRGILCLLNSFVKWLALGEVPYISVCYLQRSFTWCTNGYKEAFMSGDQEPWVFRGGLQAEFQRMLPLESAQDLFTVKAPEQPSTKTFTIRPYLPGDETQSYTICRKTCDDGLDGTEIFPDHLDLIGDKLIGGLLRQSSQYCFVVEDDTGIAAYALSALDVCTYNNSLENDYIPMIKNKYPKPEKTGNLTPAEELIMGFYEEIPSVSNELYSRFPSVIRIDVLPERLDDIAVLKRLLACVLSALKSNGSRGVHCEVSVGDKHIQDFYQKLGFLDVTESIASVTDNVLILGRTI